MEPQNLLLFRRPLTEAPAKGLRNGCPAPAGAVRYGRVPHRLIHEKEASSENFLDFAAYYAEAASPTVFVDMDRNHILSCEERVDLLTHPQDARLGFRTLVIDWKDEGPERNQRYRVTLPNKLEHGDQQSFSVTLVDAPVARWTEGDRTSTWVLFDGNFNGLFDRRFGDAVLIDVEGTGHLDLDPYGPSFFSYHLPIELPWGTFEVAGVEPAGKSLMLRRVSATAASDNRELRRGDIVPLQTCRGGDGRPIAFGGAAATHRLLYFWLSNCGACSEDLRGLVPIVRELGSERIQAIGISMDEYEEDFRRFVQTTGMAWPQCLEQHTLWDNRLARRFGVRAASTFALLDPSGRIIARGTGLTEIEAALERVSPRATALRP